MKVFKASIYSEPSIYSGVALKHNLGPLVYAFYEPSDLSWSFKYVFYQWSAGSPVLWLSKLRSSAIDEGSCKYVDQVAQRGFHLRPCARPGLFDHLNDPCISIIWSGPISSRFSIQGLYLYFYMVVKSQSTELEGRGTSDQALTEMKAINKNAQMV